MAAFDDEPATSKEWTLPAIFEGEGAITLGCALWSVPQVTEYSADNPNVGAFVVQASDMSGLFALVDGPGGTELVSGTDCAISVDWRRFPRDTRPGDRGY